MSDTSLRLFVKLTYHLDTRPVNRAAVKKRIRGFEAAASGGIGWPARFERGESIRRWTKDLRHRITKDTAGIRGKKPLPYLCRKNGKVRAEKQCGKTIGDCLFPSSVLQ